MRFDLEFKYFMTLMCLKDRMEQSFRHASCWRNRFRCGVQGRARALIYQLQSHPSHSSGRAGEMHGTAAATLDVFIFLRPDFH